MVTKTKLLSYKLENHIDKELKPGLISQRRKSVKEAKGWVSHGVWDPKSIPEALLGGSLFHISCWNLAVISYFKITKPNISKLSNVPFLPPN